MALERWSPVCDVTSQILQGTGQDFDERRNQVLVTVLTLFLFLNSTGGCVDAGNLGRPHGVTSALREPQTFNAPCQLLGPIIHTHRSSTYPTSTPPFCCSHHRPEHSGPTSGFLLHFTFSVVRSSRTTPATHVLPNQEGGLNTLC